MPACCCMKNLKTIIACFVIFISVFCSSAVLADVMPYYTSSLSKETIGFLQVPKNFTLYLYPRYDADEAETVSWDEYEVRLKNRKIEPAEMFAVQIPQRNYAFCMVVDEQDDWYKIIYDKTNNKSAWIKPAVNEDFFSLKDFYTYYGKEHGLAYMKNIDYRKRGIYSGAYPESQKLGGFTLIKTIRLNKLSGNWALVTVVDYDNKPQIGYIKWREDDGQIVIFPKMDR